MGAVTLRVENLDRMIAYYRDAVGLDLISQVAGSAVLGRGSNPALILEHSPEMKHASDNQAGLFHTAFLFDTKITGNHNSGHEFRAGQRGNGVIGRGLLPQERWALLEYLKVLGGPLEKQLP